MPAITPAGPYDAVWTNWQPSGGPLTITFADGQNVASLWFPGLPNVGTLPIALAVTGSPTFYTLTQPGSELVPCPFGAQSITLSGTDTAIQPVCSSSLAYDPYKESPIMSVYSVRLRLTGSDYTPALGPNTATVVDVPFSPADDVTPITYNVVDIFMRAETQGTAATSVNIEYYTGTGNFTATGLLNTTVLTLAANTNETVRPAAISTPTINSGTKIRANFSAISATGLTLYVMLQQVF